MNESEHAVEEEVDQRRSICGGNCPDCGSTEWIEEVSRLRHGVPVVHRKCKRCRHSSWCDRDAEKEDIAVDDPLLSEHEKLDKYREAMRAVVDIVGPVDAETTLAGKVAEWGKQIRLEVMAVERRRAAAESKAVPGNTEQFAELAEPAPVHVVEIELRVRVGDHPRVRVEGPEAAPLRLRALELLKDLRSMV